MRYIITRRSRRYLHLYYYQLQLVGIYPFFLSHFSSNVFSLLHDKHFETHQKISCRIDESIIYPPFFIIQSIDWYDDLKRVMNSFSFYYSFFMEKTAFDLLVLCSVQRDSAYTAQKINDFPLTISLVNMTKSAGTNPYFEQCQILLLRYSVQILLVKLLFE